MKKRTVIVGAGVVVVLLFGSAAFIAGRLLNGSGLPAISLGNSGLRISSNGGQQMNSLDIQPAKDLPQTSADAKGIFDHRLNNSIFVGTGKVTALFQKDQSGNINTTTSSDGPTMEVVVTAQTTIYKDVTLNQFNGNPPAGQKIQQVVEPGSLDEIGQGSLVTAWGQKVGNRIIASVLVYTTPPVVTK